MNRDAADRRFSSATERLARRPMDAQALRRMLATAEAQIVDWKHGDTAFAIDGLVPLEAERAGARASRLRHGRLAAGTPGEEVGFDGRGRPVLQRSFLSSGESLTGTVYEYGSGVVWTVSFEELEVGRPEVAAVRLHEQDGEGRPVCSAYRSRWSALPGGEVTAYDDRGRVTCIVTYGEDDDEERRIEIVRPEYDARGELVSLVIEADGDVVRLPIRAGGAAASGSRAGASAAMRHAVESIIGHTSLSAPVFAMVLEESFQGHWEDDLLPYVRLATWADTERLGHDAVALWDPLEWHLADLDVLGTFYERHPALADQAEQALRRELRGSGVDYALTLRSAARELNAGRWQHLQPDARPFIVVPTHEEFADLDRMVRAVGTPEQIAFLEGNGWLTHDP